MKRNDDGDVTLENKTKVIKTGDWSFNLNCVTVLCSNVGGTTLKTFIYLNKVCVCVCVCVCV